MHFYMCFNLTEDRERILNVLLLDLQSQRRDNFTNCKLAFVTRATMAAYKTKLEKKSQSSTVKSRAEASDTYACSGARVGRTGDASVDNEMDASTV